MITKQSCSCIHNICTETSFYYFLLYLNTQMQKKITYPATPPLPTHTHTFARTTLLTRCLLHFHTHKCTFSRKSQSQRRLTKRIQTVVFFLLLRLLAMVLLSEHLLHPLFLSPISIWSFRSSRGSHLALVQTTVSSSFLQYYLNKLKLIVRIKYALTSFQ